MSLQTTEENKELIYDYFDAWHNEDLGGLTALLSEEFVLSYTAPTGEERRLDAEEFADAQIGYFENLAELNYEIEEMVAEEDSVLVRITWGGVHDGPILGVGPTGKQIEVEEYLSFRIEDGEVEEMHLLADNLELLRQLDVQLPV
jgi:steroid delta-isomerase-like uncharacterized protein